MEGLASLWGGVGVPGAGVAYTGGAAHIAPGTASNATGGASEGTYGPHQALPAWGRRLRAGATRSLADWSS